MVLECVFDLCAEDDDEPVEAGEEEDDDDEPVGHYVVARFNLSIVLLQLSGPVVHSLPGG